MFQGITYLNLDAKGRLAVPVKHRKDLGAGDGSSVVVTVNPYDRCLWLYPEREWQSVVQKVIRLPSSQPDVRNLQRLLVGYAEVLNLDGQGRILLGKALRKYAGLDRQVAFVGQGNKFEIWDAEAWDQSQDVWIDELREKRDRLSPELNSLAL